MRLTIANSGCGLGDMLGRIDLIYKICQKYNYIFFMPEIRSNLHSINYGNSLGFNNYMPNRISWSGDIQLISLSVFLNENDMVRLSKNKNILYEVVFDYSISDNINKALNLEKYNSLDYTPYLQLPKISESFDYLVHLRLGDNYIYHIKNELYLDAGRRRIVTFYEDALEELIAKQWNLSDLSIMIEYFERKGLSYYFISDGINSVIRHINWTKSEDYEYNKHNMLSSVNSFDRDMKNSIGTNKNFLVDSEDVGLAISYLFASTNVICTTGGFMRHVNRYLNNSKCNIINYPEFIKQIKTNAN